MTKPAIKKTNSPHPKKSLKAKIAYTLLILGFTLTSFGVVLVSFVFLSLQSNLPSSEQISSTQLKTPLRVFSSEGLLIAEFGDERRSPINIQSAPQILINSILASEDSNFYSHVGIDFKGILRAAINNFRTGSKQGASTITQQVAKNFFLSSEQTYSRKIREIMLALKLESTLTKDQILNLYLNKIFLGHRAYGFAAASDVYYGKPLSQLTIAENAMLAGLPKAPSKNNPLSNPENAKNRRNYVIDRLLINNWISKEDHELALIAPLTAKRQKRKTPVNAPYVAEMVRLQILELYGEKAYWQGIDVYTHIKKAPQDAANKALRQNLLNYDKRHGFRGPVASLSNKDKSLWLNELQAIQPSGTITPAAIITVEKNTAQALSRDNETIQVTLKNSRWARKHITADSIGRAPTNLKKLLQTGDVVYIEPDTSSNEKDLWKLSQLPQAQGALISTEAKTGNIIALAGGFDFYFNNYNRATQAKRQPGSSLKPFIYAAALDKGYTSETKISGAPIVIEDISQGTVWRPQNYNKKIYPPTPLRVALAKSMNLVSVRILRAIGLEYGREYLSRFGLDKDRLAKSLSLALGSGNLTPLEVNRAYTVIANNGYLVKPKIIDRIETRDGAVLLSYKQQQLCDQCTTSSDTQAPRVISKKTSYLINSMLKDVVKFGTAKKAQSLKRNDLGGKTGTTNDYVDAWFNGFGGGLVTTAWVGFDTPQTLGHAESGGRTALPMWIDFMKVAVANKDEKHLSKPAGVYFSETSSEQPGEGVNQTPERQINQSKASSIESLF